MKIRASFWVPAILGLSVDLFSKNVVFAALRNTPQQRVDVLGSWLVLCAQRNRGGVFGILQGKSYVFVILSLVALAVVAWMLKQAGPEQRLVPVALGLVVAGALGNLADRVSLGFVRDFIYVEVIRYPAFNVADICICVAAGMLVLAVVKEGRREKARHKGGRRRKQPAKL